MRLGKVWGQQMALRPLLILAGLLTAGASNAALVTINFGGISSHNTGSNFSGTLTYDTNVSSFLTSADADSAFASYHAITSISFSAGGLSSTIESQSASNFTVQDSNTPNLNDGFKLQTADSQYEIHLNLTELYSYMSSTALPSTLSLSSFSQNHNEFIVYQKSDGQTQQVYSGILTGVSAASVPEPEAWSLMIAGFGMIGAAMRRQRKVAISFS